MADPVRLSHETIYTSLYAMPRGELRAAVMDLLRQGHKKRRSRMMKKDRRNQAIPNMTMIDERPVEVLLAPDEVKSGWPKTKLALIPLENGF